MTAAQVSSAPRGGLFGRYVQALLIAKGDIVSAAAFAEGRGPAWREVAMSLRAAVTPMDSAENATSLAFPIAFDFAEVLRPMTVVGRMVGLRRVPFNLRTIQVGTGAGASWVGEGMPVPASALDFNAGTTLTFAKVASLVVETLELVRGSTPGVEAVLTADVARAAAYAIDLAFLDPVNSGSAGVKPASVTYGGTMIPSTGSAVANIDADIRSALAVLNNANIDLSTAVWCMAPHTAVYLSTLRGTGGANAFPLATARGGFLAGLPILTSAAVGQDASSPSETYIALIAASEILLADDGASTVEVSEQASLQLDDAPQAGGATTQAVISLWQNDLAALMATRTINFQRRATAAVATITDVGY